MGGGTDQITDHELLYRRIPLVPRYHDPERYPHPSPLAFNPRENDKTGISLYRAKFRSPQEVAQNQRGKEYYIAVLRAGDLRGNGIDVVSREQSAGDGHIEIPALRYDNRHSEEAETIKMLLSQKLCLRVIGPLP